MQKVECNFKVFDSHVNASEISPGSPCSIPSTPFSSSAGETCLVQICGATLWTLLVLVLVPDVLHTREKFPPRKDSCATYHMPPPCYRSQICQLEICDLRYYAHNGKWPHVLLTPVRVFAHREMTIGQ